MSAKHFDNDPEHVVVSCLRSLTLTNPSLRYDERNKTIYRHSDSISLPKNVSVVCGGGSGHEPGFSGFVGQGLLTACVCGSIFASPSAEQIWNCLLHRLPRESQGILLIVMNYTGDVLNFGVAVEKVRAMGKKVAMLVVGDDVGVGRKKSGKVGRRGLSGTAIAVKICGALAETGAGIDDCVRVGKLLVNNLVSLGASLSRVHVPGKALEEVKEEEHRLGPGNVEIGMGIHNEPGCEKVSLGLPGLVKRMLAQMLDQSDEDRAYVMFDKSSRVVLLVNNFGGLSNLELGAIVTQVTTQLKSDYGLEPLRIIAGTIVGSLNGPGFGLSVLKLVDTGLGPGKSMLELLDVSSEATGWLAPIKAETWEKRYSSTQEVVSTDNNCIPPSNLKIEPGILMKALKSGLQRLVARESDITKFDTVIGDGDCGTELKRGANAILSMLETVGVSDDAVVNLTRVVKIIETNMGGTSGALYAIFLNSLVTNLRSQDKTSPTCMTPEIWATALKLSLEVLGRYTPAQPGDRTLLDALYPFVENLSKSGDIRQAASAAKKGAEETIGMVARLGRSVYIGGDGYKQVPDPGAYGLSELLAGVAECL